MTKKLKLYQSSVIWETCFSAGGGFELAAVTNCKSAKGKFRQLLPLHINRNLPRLTRGQVYSTYVLPHAAETWAMTGYTFSPAAQ